MASIVAVCVSDKKGTVKASVPEIYVKANHGIVGDAHAGEGHRQISLLAVESADKLRDKLPELSAGAFAENILTSGVCLHELPVGTALHIGNAVLEITQIGKACHNDGCVIKQKTGDCVMPREGAFARIITGGVIKPGDLIEVVKGKKCD